jgi:hypothetical protein
VADLYKATRYRKAVFFANCHTVRPLSRKQYYFDAKQVVPVNWTHRWASEHAITRFFTTIYTMAQLHRKHKPAPIPHRVSGLRMLAVLALGIFQGLVVGFIAMGTLRQLHLSHATINSPYTPLVSPLELQAPYTP